MQRRRRAPSWQTIGAVITAAGFSLVGFWILWGNLLSSTRISGLGSQIKDYYLLDQFVYMAVASNIVHGMPAFFVEPYTTTGHSIAPSAYFWAVGGIARVLGLTVFGAWNVLGMLVTLGLIALLIWWARWASPKSRAWAIAPAALLVGTLQWMAGADWVVPFGAHAVLWPPIATLNSPGAEPAALALTLALFITFGTSLLSASQRRIGWAVASGACLGLVALSHTYVSILAVTSLLGAVVVLRLIGLPTRLQWLSLGVLLASLVAAALVPTSSSFARLGLIVIALAALILLIPGSRRAVLIPLGLCLGTAAVVASPLIWATFREVLEPGSFFYLRQEWGREADLGLPPLALIGAFLPTLVLGVVTAISLARRPRDPRRDWWLATLVSIGAMACLFSFSHWWGFNQEPYRFVPYGVLLVTGVALPWLWEALAAADRRAWLAAPTAILLVLTIPTTAAFARASNQIFAMPEDETAAYRAIMREASGGLVLFDRCFRPELVKAVAGGEVANINRGHAIPDQYDEIQQLLDDVDRGLLPSTPDLARAGIKWVVTTTQCDGLSQEQLKKALGTPRSMSRQIGGAAGTPSTVTYLVFRVEGPGR